MHIDPNGGMGIGPDATGTEYPLVTPSTDVAGFLADFYLAYPSPSRALPLSIAWLSGMDRAYNDSVVGGMVGSGPAYTPTHDADVVVVDAAGIVVFNSTTATQFRSTAFSNRLRIYEWSDDVAVCRLVQHVALPDAGSFVPRPSQIWPVDARLDERCGEAVSRGVTSVYGQAGVRIRGGYNVTLDAAPQAIVGLRKVTRVTIGAAPGSGEGRAPGCTDVATLPHTINGVQPDANGNFTLQATNCYWVRQPVNHAVSPPATTPSALTVGDDCGPCCSCADYVRVAQAIAALFARLQALGLLAQEAACAFAKAVARWEAQKACRDALSVKLNALASGSTISAAGQFCNTTDDCINNLTLFFHYTSPVVVLPDAVLTVTDGRGDVNNVGSGVLPGVTPYAGTIYAVFAVVAPHTAVTARFRFETELVGTSTVTVECYATATGFMSNTASRTVTVTQT